MRTLVLVSVGLLIGSFALGCGRGGGDGRVNAKGRVLWDRKPFLPKDNESVRIYFLPIDEAATESYAAEYNGQAGTFTVVGKDRKGLPPGKYRISIQLIVQGNDLFRNRLAGAKSPFTCEVADALTEVTVDLGEAKDVVAAAKR
jgi:hypothetical protein